MLNVLDLRGLDVLDRLLLNILHLRSVSVLSCGCLSTNLLLIEERSLLSLLLLLLLFGLLFSHLFLSYYYLDFELFLFFWFLYFYCSSPLDSLRFSHLLFEINFYCYKPTFPQIPSFIKNRYFQPILPIALFWLFFNSFPYFRSLSPAKACFIIPIDFARYLILSFS